MAEEIINDVDENGELPDLSNLETFLSEAIETDTPIEYTVPLNDEGSFINGVGYEKHITEAEVKVTILEHLVREDFLLGEQEACDNWIIELNCGPEHTWSTQVKLNEEATFSYDDKEGLGTGTIALSITAGQSGYELSQIKIQVS
jgi:hypothetical protein